MSSLKRNYKQRVHGLIKRTSTRTCCWAMDAWILAIVYSWLFRGSAHDREEWMQDAERRMRSVLSDCADNASD